MDTEEALGMCLLLFLSVLYESWMFACLGVTST